MDRFPIHVDGSDCVIDGYIAVDCIKFITIKARYIGGTQSSPVPAIRTRMYAQGRQLALSHTWGGLGSRAREGREPGQDEGGVLESEDCSLEGGRA